MNQLTTVYQMNTELSSEFLIFTYLERHKSLLEPVLNTINNQKKV